MQPAEHHALSDPRGSTSATRAGPSHLDIFVPLLGVSSFRVWLSSVETTRPTQVVKVCSYMLEEPHHRACWLRELRIRTCALGGPSHDWYDGEGPSLPALLAGTLGAARHLCVLALPRVEELLEVDASIGTALISLERRCYVDLCCLSSCALEVAGKMASRPLEVVLGFPSLSSFPEHLMSLSHLPLLCHTSTVGKLDR